LVPAAQLHAWGETSWWLNDPGLPRVTRSSWPEPERTPEQFCSWGEKEAPVRFAEKVFVEEPVLVKEKVRVGSHCQPLSGKDRYEDCNQEQGLLSLWQLLLIVLRRSMKVGADSLESVQAGASRS
jgi:hypothetical protein